MNNEFEIRGVLVRKFDESQKTEKFKVREFVLEISAQKGANLTVDYIKMQLINNDCSKLDGIRVKSKVSVKFSIRGAKYEKEGKVYYYTNLTAYDINDLSKEEVFEDVKKEPKTTTKPDSEFTPDDNSDSATDDLPF